MGKAGQGDLRGEGRVFYWPLSHIPKATSASSGSERRKRLLSSVLGDAVQGCDQGPPGFRRKRWPHYMHLP